MGNWLGNPITLDLCAAKFCWDVFFQTFGCGMFRRKWWGFIGWISNRQMIWSWFHSQIWSKPCVDIAPWDWSIKEKFPVWRFTHLHFSFQKKKDRWKPHSHFCELMRLSDIQTWFNMQDATKNTSLSLKDKKDVSKTHTQTVFSLDFHCWKFLRSRWNSVELFWDPRCAKPIMSSWFMSRKERCEGKFFLDVSHPWNAFIKGVSLYFFIFWLIFL